MAAPGDRTGAPVSGKRAPTPGVDEPDEPFALRFAWLIAAAAAAMSIGLVVSQTGWEWPFAPTRTTTTSQVLGPKREGR